LKKFTRQEKQFIINRSVTLPRIHWINLIIYIYICNLHLYVREIEERSLEAINGVGNKRYTSTPKSTCLQFSLRLTNYPPDGCCPLHGHSTTSSTVAFLATRSIMLWIKTARPLDLAKIAYSLDGSRYDFAWYPRWCRFPFPCSLVHVSHQIPNDANVLRHI
jgi:hypothetical protein